MVLFSIGVYNIHSLAQQNEELRKTKASLEGEVRNVNSKLSGIQDEVSGLNQSLHKQDEQIKKQDNLIKELNKATKHRDKVIKELRTNVKQKDNKIESQRKQLISKAEAKKKEQNRMVASAKESKVKTYTPQTKVSNQTVHKSKNVNVARSSKPVQTGNKVSGGQTFSVSFYTSNAESTGKSAGHPAYGVTASGARVQEGVTAACPPSMPFGTRVHIEGFGTRVCQDRGSAITSGKLDVYVGSVSQARSLGRKNLKVSY